MEVKGLLYFVERLIVVIAYTNVILPLYHGHRHPAKITQDHVYVMVFCFLGVRFVLFIVCDYNHLVTFVTPWFLIESTLKGLLNNVHFDVYR